MTPMTRPKKKQVVRLVNKTVYDGIAIRKIGRWAADQLGNPAFVDRWNSSLVRVHAGRRGTEVRYRVGRRTVDRRVLELWLPTPADGRFTAKVIALQMLHQPHPPLRAPVHRLAEAIAAALATMGSRGAARRAMLRIVQRDVEAAFGKEVPIRKAVVRDVRDTTAPDDPRIRRYQRLLERQTKWTRKRKTAETKLRKIKTALARYDRQGVPELIERLNQAQPSE